MSMSDEQFEDEMEALEDCGNEDFVAAMRARDAAQREALARVEAELDTERARGDAAVGDANEAEAQLAEALGEIRIYQQKFRYIAEGGSFYLSTASECVRLTSSFLAMHANTAQAEQQEALSDAELMEVAMFEGSGNKAARRAHELGLAELPEHLAPRPQEAQGAQAGDERTAFESAWSKRLDLSRDKLSGCYYSQATEWRWEGWQARAALATQPAAGEPVEIEVPTFSPEGMGCGLEDRGITDRYEAMEYGYNEALEQQWAIINSHGPLFAAPPSAGKPVFQLRNPKIGPEWNEVDRVAYEEFASMPAYERRTLWTAPPAAAHGDEAVTNLVPGLQWAIDYCNAMQRQGNERMLVEVIRKRLENVRDNQPAAMRAQGDGEVQ